MNKSVSISLGGLSFFIEEDAFKKLQGYLEDVKSSLETGEEDTTEIIKDVEARIAELFKEWLGNYRQVVDIKDVDKMIGIMGTPEQYQSELGEEESVNSEKSQNTNQSKEKEGSFYKRQLFRDTDNKMLAGVCSGLSHFFGIEPIWFRLGTVLLFLFSSQFLEGLSAIIFWAYIILWIVMPKARTTSDKLKMSGKPVNFDSIKGYVNKEEISEQAGKIKQNISKASNGLGDFLENFFKILVKILAICIGILCVIFGVSFIISYFACSFSLSLSGENSFQYMNLLFDSSWQLYIMIILLGIVVLIPSLLLILLGLRLITERKIIKTTLAALITTFVLWFVSIIILIIMIVSLIALEFSDSIEKTNKYIVNTSSDTLNVVMNEYDKEISTFHYKKIGIHLDDIKFTKEGIVNKMDRKLEVKQSLDSNFYLEVKSTASGRDEITAQKNLSMIEYKYRIENNQLDLNTYFSIPINSKYRNQEVKLTLYIPKDKYIKTNNIKKISHREKGGFDIYRDNEDNSNKVFKFTDNSLKCITCNESDGFYIDEDSDARLSIDKDGIRMRSGKDSVEVNINKKGIKIKNHGTGSL